MAAAPVVILGAGFAGCATAWALARRGVAAIVIEREPELGRYASGRGAGLGRQLCEDDVTSELAIRGAERLRTELAASWSPTGGVLCFDDATHASEYVARAERLGVTVDVIDRSRVIMVWPQLARVPIAAALYVPTDGVIDAGALLRAYSSVLTIRLGSTATRIEPTATGARVHLATVTVPFAPSGIGLLDTAPADAPSVTHTAIDARVVVDATGAWAGELVGDLPLDSFKRHLFVVEATSTVDAPYVWHLGKQELYLRADASGVLLSPCDGDPTSAADQQPSRDADARLHARFGNAPDFTRARIVKRWACQRAFAPDRLMRLGRDPQRPWLVWAAALGGHGATASPAVGEVVADAVIESLGALG